MAILAAPNAPLPNLPASPELELKFVLPGSLAPVLLPWLQATCLPHPEFPVARTSSVYYDTADWRLLNEKLGSDYFKQKVRLRWYAGTRDDRPAGPAFIEAKLKEGARRDKVRFRLPEPAGHWAATDLESAAFSEALEALRSEGLTDLGRLRPAFQIGYRRHRFVHPFSRSTLCLDTDILVERVHRNRFRHRPCGPLSLAVLEQKGPLDRLDPAFGDLCRFGARRSAFSKYQHCFAHLMGTFL